MTQDNLQENRHSETDGTTGSNRASYDFERLERSVEFLLEEHERLSSERAALLEELVESKQQVSALEQRLDRERTRRLAAVEGVDKVLARLEQLQASVARSVESAGMSKGTNGASSAAPESA